MFTKAAYIMIPLCVLLVSFSAYGDHGQELSEKHSTQNMKHDHHDHQELPQEEPAQQSMKHGHLITFGPGEAPHYHALDVARFDKVLDIAKKPEQLPPPIKRKYPTTVKIALLAKEVIAEIAPEITYHYWAFNETVPGPFLRVREGDTVELTLTNDHSSSHPHSIDLHAVTGPGGGSILTQVQPGETKILRFKALKPGLFVYHCASGNVPLHMTSGLYGLILVEPKKKLPKVDREFYVMQGELYTAGAIGENGFQGFNARKMLYETPEYVFFNGRVNALVDHPPTLIPAGGAAIIEFTLEVPGRYILVDHALARIDKGAWGVLEVQGPENPEIYSGKIQ